MSSPRSRARVARGALVGLSSAVVTAGAHAAAGGALPNGAALAGTALCCATVGGAVAGARLDGRWERRLAVFAALLLAQSFGHLVLTLTAEHAHDGLGASPAMIAAHLVGAVGLGLLIDAVEYLYLVASSVLCWLRLFTSGAQRASTRPAPMFANDVVALLVLLVSGLGMRAPPRGGLSAA